MDRRKLYAFFMLIDLALLIFLFNRLTYAIYYAIDYFSSAIDNILMISVLILTTFYSLFLHYKFRNAEENKAEKIHFWIYITLVIIYLAPLIIFYILKLINPQIDGFGVGILYVGLSMIIGIIWIINTLITGSIALKNIKPIR